MPKSPRVQFVIGDVRKTTPQYPPIPTGENGRYKTVDGQLYKLATGEYYKVKQI